jgi:cation diffusion facilitator CzcD-associated flavoprotein CzcO
MPITRLAVCGDHGASASASAMEGRRVASEMSCFAILEGRSAIGGTWDIFRYPGIRSDTDLYTFGYEFKPWTGENVIGGGEEIITYLRETIEENRLNAKIRLNHRVLTASWSTPRACWLLDVQRTDTGERFAISCDWLYLGTGYYRYDRGYIPEFPQIEEFKGQVVHPQQWPEDLDYAGKRVVVIGSGATAVTLVPAMAPDTAHITMLQRSPTYILPIPSSDPLVNYIRKLAGARVAHRLARLKYIAATDAIYNFCQHFPRTARRLIRALNVRQLPAGYPVDVDFKPHYDPWEQRLCAVPDGDLFKAISRGQASVVTDEIEAFTPSGIVLRSGRTLDADIVVTATGLQLSLFGGISVIIDGKEISHRDTVAFKGLMLSGIPNSVFAIGYTNRSWALKVDLISQHLCRMIAHMDAHGYEICVPELPGGAAQTKPLLDFAAGYVKRSLAELPRAGTRAPWNLSMSHNVNRRQLRRGPVDDPNLRFSRGLRTALSDELEAQPEWAERSRMVRAA